MLFCRIQQGNITALTTNFEVMMDDNDYHHSKEQMFVAGSSWITPKGSPLQVESKSIAEKKCTPISKLKASLIKKIIIKITRNFLHFLRLAINSLIIAIYKKCNISQVGNLDRYTFVS